MRTTLGRFLRPSALALLLGVVPLAPALAQMVLHMPTASQSAAPQQRALGLAVGEALRLENLSLDESSRTTATAELRRMAVTDAQTRFVVHSGEQSHDIAAPERAHFSGQLAGEPQSLVFVSIDGDGSMRSIIDRAGEVFVSEVRPGSAQRPASALARRIDQKNDFSERIFSCDVTPQFIEKNRTPATPASIALRQALRNATPHTAKPYAGASSVQRRADIIIETDYELFQRLGGSSQLSAYVTDLFGYINARYQSEVGTRLNLKQVNIYTTAADPWTRSRSREQLDDLRAYWNAAPRSTQARHHVHLLSAKDGGGGVAYLDTLYEPSYAYGVSTGIEGSFSAANPQIVWDAVEVAHEMGHAFGSAHTHEFDDPYLGSAQGGAIDCCYADSTGSQCAVRNGGAGRNGALPGIGSLSGGAPGQRTGTIMSYCHTMSPGMSNISFNFGTNHPYGVYPERVADVLRASSQSHLPIDNVAPPVSYTLTVTPSGTGSGSVSSSPSGIQCGSDCAEDYVSGSNVTLTAAPATGSTFNGWSGSCSGTSNTCSIRMDGARYVGAVFTSAATTRLVTVSKSGAGAGNVTSSPSGLSCLTDCGVASASFASNTAITLIAQAATGSQFAGWSGACSGTSINCSITAGASSASVTANFAVTAATTRTLTVVKSGVGTGTVAANRQGWVCDPSCSKIWGDIPSSTVITLTAQAATGSQFAGWSGACSGTSINCTLAAGTSALNVTATFNTSSGGGGTLTDPTLFVAQQYRDLFNRSPDAASLNYWAGQLKTGVISQAQLIESFMAQADFKDRYGPLVRLYTAYFRRIPDYGGLMYWYGELYPANGGNGRLFNHVSDSFAQSAEFVGTYGSLNNLAFAELVYQNVLGRTAEPAGRDYWVGRLNAGLIRGEMMIGFSESAENVSINSHANSITMAYAGMLRRAPSAMEQRDWLNEMNAGRANTLSLINSLMKSAEYVHRFP